MNKYHVLLAFIGHLNLLGTIHLLLVNIYVISIYELMLMLCLLFFNLCECNAFNQELMTESVQISL